MSEVLANRYQIIKQLKKRAGRETLLVKDLDADELAVAKLFKFGIDSDWQDWKLFEREAKVLQQLSHQCIPQYLDYFELEQPGYRGFALIQSHIATPSLAELIDSGTHFELEEIEQLAIAILDILIYLHQQQPPIIHRDLKPSNILWDRQKQQVYLVDFGSVQTLAATEGGTITVVGTYGYMPPEQFGDRTVPASDLYSLGATLIYLLTGVQAADLPRRAGKIGFDQQNLTPSFARWLQRLVEPDLDDRFSSATEAKAALIEPLKLATQPLGSRIRLSAEAQAIVITLPPQGYSLDLLFTGLIGIGTVGFLGLWLTIIALSPTPASITWLLTLFTVPFWGVSIYLIARVIVALLAQTRLKIDSQQIKHYYQILGFKFAGSPGVNSQAIEQIEYQSLTNSIAIVAGNYRYVLGINNRWQIVSGCQLTQPETMWLAQQLSLYLNIPVKAVESDRLTQY